MNENYMSCPYCNTRKSTMGKCPVCNSEPKRGYMIQGMSLCGVSNGQATKMIDAMDQKYCIVYFGNSDADKDIRYLYKQTEARKPGLYIINNSVAFVLTDVNFNQLSNDHKCRADSAIAFNGTPVNFRVMREYDKLMLAYKMGVSQMAAKLSF